MNPHVCTDFARAASTSCEFCKRKLRGPAATGGGGKPHKVYYIHGSGADRRVVTCHQYRCKIELLKLLLHWSAKCLACRSHKEELATILLFWNRFIDAHGN